MLRKDYAEILYKRRYLLEGEKPDEKAAYYAAYLVNHFAILVDNPDRICEENVDEISSYYHKEVPESFYKSPQDLKYYTCEELYLEKMLSYFLIRGKEHSADERIFKNPEIVKKVLPKGVWGKELVKRQFHVVTKKEADELLFDIMKQYCAYTRPWSEDDMKEVGILLRGDYYDGSLLACKDNVINVFMLTGEKKYAKKLDYKDVVKLSIILLGEKKRLRSDSDAIAKLKIAAENAQPCPVSKRQAKYFNKVIKLTNAEVKKVDNSTSPYAIARKLADGGDVLGAAKYLKENGALFTRSIVWLLSRLPEEQTGEFMGMVASHDGKPIVNIQLMFMLLTYDVNKARTFRFYKNGRLRSHSENERDAQRRKWHIDEKKKQAIIKGMIEGLKRHYASRPSLGKVFIAENFRKVYLPLNTSASGHGIDILPTGSRVPLKGNYIRAFCFWKNIFDVDLAVIFENAEGEHLKLNWRTYDYKPLGNSALMSGDNRDMNGAEYADFAVNEVLERGWKYGVVLLNGYDSNFSKGQVYCGYQDKDDLNTQVWKPDNIAMQIHVKGEGSQFFGFAIDFERREIIILNIMGNSERVAKESDVDAIKQYLDPVCLDAFSMYDLISMRGQVVDSPEEADVVFDNYYEAKEGQKTVRPWEVEELVNLI